MKTLSDIFLVTSISGGRTFTNINFIKKKDKPFQRGNPEKLLKFRIPFEVKKHNNIIESLKFVGCPFLGKFLGRDPTKKANYLCTVSPRIVTLILLFLSGLKVSMSG